MTETGNRRQLNDRKTYRQGLAAALGCSTLWGLIPIYWQSLRPINSEVIILYRIVMMAIVCFIGSVIFYGFKETIKPLISDKKLILTHIATGILITANWSLYIWAVNANFVIQTCMGYFLEPLVVCAFGVVIFKEKLNKSKKAALIMALLGLGVMVAGYKEIPLIALGLAGTFSVYAAIKKNVKTKPMQSLFYETLFLLPIALLLIVRMETAGNGALAVCSAGGASLLSGLFSVKFLLILLSGLFTAIPLGLFSLAATKLPLVTLGLTEYMSPSLSLILGIFLFKEPFDSIQFTAFVLIWIGLSFFTYGEVKDDRR
ncbi:MAG: EamA family transporter RarD [Hornefia sp.]|nr:EamA family transporter RarD [Hornefia sp.]